MRANPVDLIGGFYQDDSLPWACQDTVNWIPEAAEAAGTRTPTILRDAPGLRPKVQVGTGPIRGMRNVEGKLLVVSGTQLYQISNDLVAIPRGVIPGTGRVSMAHNSRSGGNQVTIVNGNAGYVYDTNALTLTRITDNGYPGAFVVDFVDGYMAQIEPLRRYWFHSELTQALDFNTLDRYPAEGQPDALVTLLVDHREVWVFGERTIEPFVNTGALTNTFARASNTVIENGCSAKFSPAKLDNSIFWLDDLGIVRRAQGYTATRVSTAAIESAIAALDWSRAFGFTVTERGHAIYYLTFPDGYTFGYDITTGLWHRRASYGLDRWRVAAVAYWNGAYICGDFQQGLLYTLDWEYPYDGVLPHVRERVTGVTHDNQNRVLIPYAELVIDNGREPVASVTAPAQPEGPTIIGSPPDGTLGEAYTFTFTATGGTPPYVFSHRSGTLPPDLAQASTGILSGTLSEVGTFESLVTRVTDANGLWDDITNDIRVYYPATLVTDYDYYSGDPGAMALGLATGFSSVIKDVSPSLYGLYLSGSDIDSLAASRYQLRKYNTATQVYDALANPADFPVSGPDAQAWHPSGDYLLLTDVNASSNEDWMIYARSGDTFTKISDPSVWPSHGSSSCGWDHTGTRFFVSNAITNNQFGVYDFTAGAIGTLNTGLNVINGQNITGGEFRPIALDPYLALRMTGGSVVVVNVANSPPTIVAQVADTNGAALKWTADGRYIISLRSTGPDYLKVWEFNAGAGTLTDALATIEQPTWSPFGMSVTSDRRYMAIRRDSGTDRNVPYVWSVSAATPPVLDLLAPLSGGASTLEAINFVPTE